MYEFISNEQYPSCADQTYKRGMTLPAQNLVLWCHTNDILQAFEAISAQTGNRYILISSGGDYGCGGAYHTNMPPNLVKWFSVNAQKRNTEDQVLQGIPVGLGDTCYRGTSFDHGNRGALQAEIETKREWVEGKLVFTCFCDWTNGDRKPCADYFADKPWSSNFTFNKFDAKRFSFTDYLRMAHSHPYVISPWGGGVDCHRVWEALYLHVVPITRKHPAISWFTDLPIVQVDQWSDVTPDFLLAKEKELQAGSWNWPKLWMPYWREKIAEARTLLAG